MNRELGIGNQESGGRSQEAEVRRQEVKNNLLFWSRRRSELVGAAAVLCREAATAFHVGSAGCCEVVGAAAELGELAAAALVVRTLSRRDVVRAAA